MNAIGKTDTYEALGKVNLNHLLYFWAVARSQSVSGAAKRLGVSQPSVSEQVRALERRLGVDLLERTPRGVRLTPQGAVAMRYAEEVVGLCADIVRFVPELHEPSGVPPLAVGTADAVPKVIVRMLLQPLLDQGHAPSVVCSEWRVDHLLAELSLHRLDLIIADAPLDDGHNPGMVSVLAGSSKVDLYAKPTLARRLRGRHPGRLSTVPWLLPTLGGALRASLDRWFALHRVTPRVAAEAEDRALLHHFAEAGLGVVPVATSTARDVARQFRLVRVGTARDVQEQYFVIAMRRERQHPGLAALLQTIAAKGHVATGRVSGMQACRAR